MYNTYYNVTRKVAKSIYKNIGRGGEKRVSTKFDGMNPIYEIFIHTDKCKKRFKIIRIRAKRFRENTRLIHISPEIRMILRISISQN